MISYLHSLIHSAWAIPLKITTAIRPSMSLTRTTTFTAAQPRLDTCSSADPENAVAYWYRTCGHHVAAMLQEANYPTETQLAFLAYFEHVICPQLGSQPDASWGKSAMAWDGSPFEYSFEFKGTTENPVIRLSADFSEVRGPERTANPLSVASTQKILDSLAQNAYHFDDTWHQSLRQYLTCAHFPLAERQALVSAAGHQTSVGLGFDIGRSLPASGKLPIMAKDYFPSSWAAATKGISSWEATSQAVRQLPDVNSYPNIITALEMIESYLDSKPGLKEKEGIRGLSTDCVKPGQARLKVYMRYHGDSFDELWDLYTLGGRIPSGGFDADKEVFRDLMESTSGPAGLKTETKNPQKTKPTAVYFSLSPGKPFPVPKMYFYPAISAENDLAIATGLDAWFVRHGWYHGGRTMVERLSNIFTHRKLDETTGIFAYIGVGRGKGSGLSLQVYVTPELYDKPR